MKIEMPAAGHDADAVKTEASETSQVSGHSGPSRPEAADAAPAATQASDAKAIRVTRRPRLPKPVADTDGTPPLPDLPASRPDPVAGFVVDCGAPSRVGPHGIRYDFNYGCRVQVPAGAWRVRLTDIDTDVVLFDEVVDDGVVSTLKKYYVRFRIEVFRGEDEDEGKGENDAVFRHDYDAAGQKVYMRLPVGTLGDIIAWFPYVDEFRKRHDCELYVSMGPQIWSLFADAYPQLHYVAPADEASVRPDCYASYFPGIFFPCDDRSHQPTDFRVSGLQKTIPYLLGLPPLELRPRIAVADPVRRIAEPYVVVAAQSSSQCKYWNHPTGWYELIRHLKSIGYRVLCIDRQHAHGEKLMWNLIPYGSEDFTGDLPLQERVNLLQHADFFIGLSSGLSWLAWALQKPVVMISGFTHPHNEFETPYRAINFHACNSCWNDTGIEFDHQDFAWCPRHAGTDRQFECSRLITPRHVIRLVEQLMKDHALEPRREPIRLVSAAG